MTILIFPLRWLSFVLTLSLMHLLLYFKTLLLLVHCYPMGKSIVPVWEKNDKQIVSNYRPVSPLPICGKSFEKLIFNELFILRAKVNPSGLFMYLSTTCSHLRHLLKFCLQFISRDPLCVFFYISKAFDRVWHDGLLFKLKQNSASGNLFQLITSFLSNRFKRFILNGQISDWESICASIQQRSFLRTLFFLLYIQHIIAKTFMTVIKTFKVKF